MRSKPKPKRSGLNWQFTPCFLCGKDSLLKDIDHMFFAHLSFVMSNDKNITRKCWCGEILNWNEFPGHCEQRGGWIAHFLECQLAGPPDEEEILEVE